MRDTIILFGSLAALGGCGGEGTWTVEIWGEDYIEVGIPADDFADGCSVVFDRFELAVAEVALLDGDGAVVAEVEAEPTYDVTIAGPTLVGEAPAAATHYDTVRFSTPPSDALGGASMEIEGTLTCGEEAVSFSWSFDTDTTYLCEPEELTIPAGGEDGSMLTIHGDHLFYDSLDNPDAQLRGQAIVDADADLDGVVTQAELQAVGLASLGYDVGSWSEVTELEGFIAALTHTLGHIDGEGHCQIEM
jgi:hypothetical protein